MICRQKYATREERSKLVENLIHGHNNTREPHNFEEIKLVLALAWQRGRWDRSDAGRGGYGEVLASMVDARRYEVGDEVECSRLLVQDMKDRFEMLNPTADDLAMMRDIFDSEPDMDSARRRCSGLVLKAMGFIQNGL
ncbi:hypothetical protein IV203_038283 [Nitzschia inconspicua]|uniref:Uncharacterized protein n=1 Tax=Nitzschia inconspicua TaxID=303405 RepID=A0A9K3PZM4_9STRA|nr:hypothetical protein IV203_038283 [Nitzschia inconspicua]